MNARRAEQVKAFDAWAAQVDPRDLRSIDTSALRRVGSLAQERNRIEADLVDAVAAARAKDCSWSQIGLMLGVTRQAAQQRYGSPARA